MRKPGRLATNTLLGTFWQGFRVVGQAAWVILLARSVSADGYGQLAGLAGLATSLGGLTGLGVSLLLVKRVSVRSELFSVYWHLAVRATVITGLALMVLFTSLAPTIAHVSATWPIVVALGFSELICLPLINVASLSFQAHEQLGWSSWVSALSSIGRVSAAVLFMLFSDRHTLDNYAIFHIAGSTCAVALAYMFAVHRLAPSRAIWKWSGADVREGLTFSGLWFTSNATVELDKVLALRFAGAEVTGVYSASYRVATVASLPIAALLLAMQPRMFRAHATGDDTARLIRLALAAIIGYSVVGIALLQIASPLIPRILGESFHHAADASRMLAWMMPFYGVRLLGTSVLTARGRQGARAFTECTGLLVMFVAAAWLEPRWGLQGAVVTVIMTECVLAALSWTLVRRFSVDTTRPAS